MAPSPASVMPQPNSKFSVPRLLLFLSSGIALAVILLAVRYGWSFFSAGSAKGTGPEAAEKQLPPPGFQIGFPTRQNRLCETGNPAVFMPTGSGRIESAFFGTVRTRMSGRALLPAFHEGIDIAPLERDRGGRALDPVFAVAEGRVGYVNRIGGNSSYGAYVVLLHGSAECPFYTLYSHLGAVEPGLKAGDAVHRGMPIGRMGNSSTLGIPVQRSHLHFEFGTVLNSRFGEWYRKRNLKPYHGSMHGYNLAGFNPLDLVPSMETGRHFVMEEYLLQVPPAFRLIVRTASLPDFYRRYPFLWSGGDLSGAIVMDVSESGSPLRARPATPEEAASLKKGGSRVLEVFPAVLGRNGERLVVQSRDGWTIGRNATQWLEILLYR